MFNTFKKPYPLITDFINILLTNFTIGVFVGLFLIVFQPFGISLWQIKNKTIILAGFGLISFLTPTIYQIIKNIGLNNTKTEDNWTVGKEIISSIIVLGLIAFFNQLYFSLVTGIKISIFGYLQSAITVIAIGIFPISFGLINKHNKFKRLNEEKVKLLNNYFENEKSNSQKKNDYSESKSDYFERISIEATEINDNKKDIKIEITNELVFTAENTKDKLHIKESEFLYIEAEDNYSAIYYLENNKLKRNLMRSSLKRLLEQIENPLIIQCHRAFIVNLNQVKHIDGNAAGYKLKLKNVNEEIPVSRNYAKTIVSTLNQLNHE
jgi:DNA-binding LytR/AlgR family response regulator